MKVLVRQRDLSDDYLRFAVLETLREVGFNGGLQMDHLPPYDDDGQRSATALHKGVAPRPQWIAI